MSDTLLIIEDEALLGQELLRRFRREGWETVLATNCVQARHLLLDRVMEPAVVLSDMTLPDGNALDLLEQARNARVPGEWVMLTGYGSVPDSVRAVKLGAYDFLEKPADIERLQLVLAGAARAARAQRRLYDQSARQHQRYSPASFVGSSAAVLEVREMLERLSNVPFSALIIAGETGTGKGLAARILHHSGPRRDGPLVEVNCAALPKDLMEGELFGHEAGAFTGAKGRHRGLMEQAVGGSLFLDEIGEMPAELQVKVLKAVEDKRIRRLGGDSEIPLDIQIIAASNRDLEEEVRAGRFRADLYHRLSVFRLVLPPLRQRKQDIRSLASLFIDEFNAKSGKKVQRVFAPVWQQLETHDWPGNVRELRNVIERCVLFSEGADLPERWLLLGQGATAPGIPASGSVDGLWLPLDGTASLEDMERTIVEAALTRSHGNITGAARLLKSTRETLRYRVEKFGLSKPPG